MAGPGDTDGIRQEETEMADPKTDSITIRWASGADAGPLQRLAGLDSKRLPRDDFLIAEIGGQPGAAVGIRSGTVVADPFRRTAEAVDLLWLRARRAGCSGRTVATAPRLLRRPTTPLGSGCR